MSMWDTVRRPTSEETASYRTSGWWRDTTFVDDVRRHARERPEHPAVIAYESGEHARTLTYAQLAETVERLAAGLAGLGVGRRDVVVLYLPNLWQVPALYLACIRLGAVAAPVIPALNTRELGHVLADSGATVCITVDERDGVDYGARVVEAASPALKHRVVIGDAARTSALPFDALLADERPPPVTEAAGADDPVFLLYTSGTAGVMKGVVHTPNTLYASVRVVSESHELGAGDVIAIPTYMTHMAGATYAGLMPVLLGGTNVVQDTNLDMGLLLDLIERHRVTWMYASPMFAAGLIVAQREKPRDVTSLDRVVSGSAPVPPALIAEVREVFDVPLHTLWGMTENGAVTVGQLDDPEGWGAHSDGKALPWMRVRIEDSGAEDGEGRLWVHGANQCLGYFKQREIYDECLDADGWFDTGDMARPDGRGGIRITGRRVDLITRGNAQKVSSLEVEAELMRHPAVKDVAIVGYPDKDMPGGELVCAVVVPEGAPPTVRELRDFLAAQGMTWLRWPDRVQFVWELPRNSIGKVLRRPLRERLELAERPRQ